MSADRPPSIIGWLVKRSSLAYLPLNYTISFFFFFNDTATTEIYTLSLHDALPIWRYTESTGERCAWLLAPWLSVRSEEHTSELQSRLHLVCRLLLEKKKNNI